MELALAVESATIFGLLGVICYSLRSASQERKRLLNAALARTPTEFALLNRQDARTPRVGEPDMADQITPIGL